MKKKGRMSFSPVSGIANSWDKVSACKMFFPCESANLIEMVSAGSASPAYTNSLSYDASKYAVRSSGLTIPAEDFSTSSTFDMAAAYQPLIAGKSSIFMYAGYFDFQPGDTTTNGARVSLSGESSAEGENWIPRWGNAMQHVLMDAQDPVGDPGITITTGATYVAAAHGGLTETALIESSVGSGGYFYKMAIYRPDGNIMEVNMCNGTTGVTIGSYTGDTYDSAIFDTDLYFQQAIKIAGVKTTGIIRLDFDTIPSNYLTLSFIQSAEWARGNKIVLPQWNQ
jgi:hypothetical protein